MKISSKKFSNLIYAKGEEVFAFPEDAALPFAFDASEDVTVDDEAMKTLGEMLDRIEELELAARTRMLSSFKADADPSLRQIRCFFAYYRDDCEDAGRIFCTQNPAALSFEEMASRLKLVRFGSFMDEEAKKPLFVLDFAFDTDQPEEVLAAYFNHAGELLEVSHEGCG